MPDSTSLPQPTSTNNPSSSSDNANSSGADTVASLAGNHNIDSTATSTSSSNSPTNHSSNPLSELPSSSGSRPQSKTGSISSTSSRLSQMLSDSKLGESNNSAADSSSRVSFAGLDTEKNAGNVNNYIHSKIPNIPEAINPSFQHHHQQLQELTTPTNQLSSVTDSINPTDIINNKLSSTPSDSVVNSGNKRLVSAMDFSPRPQSTTANTSDIFNHSSLASKTSSGLIYQTGSPAEPQLLERDENNSTNDLVLSGMLSVYNYFFFSVGFIN